MNSAKRSDLEMQFLSHFRTRKPLLWQHANHFFTYFVPKCCFFRYFVGRTVALQPPTEDYIDLKVIIEWDVIVSEQWWQAEHNMSSSSSLPRYSWSNIHNIVVYRKLYIAADFLSTLDSPVIYAIYAAESYRWTNTCAIRSGRITVCTCK